MRTLDLRNALQHKGDILKDIAQFLQALAADSILYDLGDARDLGDGVAAITLEKSGACARAVLYLPHCYLDPETPYGRMVLGLIGRFAENGMLRRLQIDGVGDMEAARWARGRAFPGDVTPRVTPPADAGARSTYYRARRRGSDPATGSGGLALWVFDPPAGHA